MNDDELRNIFDTLRRFSENVERTGDPLLDYRNQVQRAAQAAEEEANKRKAAMEKQRQVVAQYSQTLLGGIQRMTEGKGSFAALNIAVDITTKLMGSLASAIPLVGGALKGLAEGTGEAAKFIIAEFDKMLGVFEQLNDSGVVRTIEDLRDASKKTGMNFEDVNKVYSKSGRVFAMLGSSAQEGADRFEELAKASQETRKQFARLGVGITDFNEYQLAYMQRLQISGQLKGKVDQQLIDGTKEYILELDAISKITGKSRKELQAERDKRARESQFAAFVAKMTAERRQPIEALIDILGSVDPQKAAGMKDMIVRGSVQTQDSIRLVQQTGNISLQIMQKVRSGAFTMDDVGEALKAMSQQAKVFVDQYGGEDGVAAKMRDGVLMFENFAGVLDLATKEEFMTMELAKYKARQQTQDANSQTAALADTRQKLYDVSRGLTDVATSSETAAKAIRIMAHTMNSLTNFLQTKFGASEATASSGPSWYEKGIPGLGYKALRAAGSLIGRGFSAADAAAGASASGLESSLSFDKANVEKYISFVSGDQGAGSYERFMQMQPDVREKFLTMAIKYQRNTGEKIRVLSSVRTYEEQKNLYNRRGQPGVYMPTDPDKKDAAGNRIPTIHETGRALDINESDLLDLINRGYISEHGFKTINPLSADPVHIHMRRGGVTKFPGTGQLAELHGNELVQPLNQDSVLQELATTPSMGGKTASKFGMKDLLDETRQMTRKYDEMLRIMSEMKNIQRTLMMRTYA